MGRRSFANSLDRVKLPKTFLAVNLSDAFSFQEKQNSESLEAAVQNSESQERPSQSHQTTQTEESDVLEMKGFGRGGAPAASTEPAVAQTKPIDPAKEIDAAEQLR